MRLTTCRVAVAAQCVLLVAYATGCGGSSTATTASSPTAPTSPSAPGAPTNVVATARDASASVAFTAPASTGGAAITGYTAICTGGGASKSNSAAASPITVSGLANGTVYSCSVIATNTAGSGAPSTAASVTPVAATASSTSTGPVTCSLTYSALNTSPKVNATSTYAWTCSSTSRIMTGNGIPDHPVTGGNFATPVGVQVVSRTYTLSPVASAIGLPTQIIGYALNAVKFDPGTAGTCVSTATSTAPGGGCVAAGGQDPWRIEALGGSFTFGTDENNAHVQPDGAYHYHGMPEGIITRANKGQAMTLVGWATDGFPMYARYGYTVAGDATSPLKVLRGSWQKKATPDAGRPSVTIFLMGTFQQDWEYVAGSGDLDECNGRTGVTPEFPGGIYHYYITETYPYIQRCVKGR